MMQINKLVFADFYEISCWCTLRAESSFTPQDSPQIFLSACMLICIVYLVCTVEKGFSTKKKSNVPEHGHKKIPKS